MVEMKDVGMITIGSVTGLGAKLGLKMLQKELEERGIVPSGQPFYKRPEWYIGLAIGGLTAYFATKTDEATGLILAGMAGSLIGSSALEAVVELTKAPKLVIGGMEEVTAVPFEVPVGELVPPPPAPETGAAPAPAEVIPKVY